MSEQKLPAVDQPKRRRNLKERVPLNGDTRNVLSINYKDPDYEYRWVISDPERVAKFEDAWWEVDTDPRNQRAGDRKVDTSAGTSSVVETKAGGGRKYVLMKLPKELYQKDQKAKHDRIDEIEAEMTRDARRKGLSTGELTIDRSGKVGSSAPLGS